MSYASSHNPQPVGTGTYVQDPKWRLRHSAWLLAPILGLGVFGCIGFVYIAVRTRNRRLWKIAAIYSGVSVLLAVSLSTVSAASAMNSINGLLVIALWIGGTIHAVILNREYLTWRATSRPWYANATVPNPATPYEQQERAAPPLQHLGMDTQQYFAPTPTPSPTPTNTAAAVNTRPTPSPGPTGPIDVNNADEAALAKVPGLDSQWARHIVAVRSSRRGFASLADFTEAVGIQPHHLIRVQNHITFSPIRPPEGQHQSRPTRGRIVDI